MKIAVVTNNGKYISQHFGRSRYYKIYTLENNKIIESQMRQRKTGHFALQQNVYEESHSDVQGRHGFGTEAQSRHSRMVAEISDCDVLIAGGMGTGAYENFKSAGLDVILTDHADLEEAIFSYAKGELENLYTERID